MAMRTLQASCVHDGLRCRPSAVQPEDPQRRHAWEETKVPAMPVGREEREAGNESQEVVQ